jgi:hypothetical protein
MRRFCSLLVLGLVFGCAACGEFIGDDDGDDARDHTARARGSKTSDGGRSVSDAERDAGGGGTTGDASSGAPGSTSMPMAIPGTGVDPAVCAAPVATASLSCSVPDAFEPNNTPETAIPLDVGTSCAFVPSKLSTDSGHDYYSFVNPRRDPVRVQLAYEDNGTGPRLSLWLNDHYFENAQRSGAASFVDTRFVHNKGMNTIEVVDSGGTGCRGYNLMVDTGFCTDELEDNDSEMTATQGLSYGKTFTASAFYDDKDYFDLSAIRALGATCTVTSDLKPMSWERLGFEVTYGNGDFNYSYLDGSSSGPSIQTLTFKAGTDAVSLEISSEFQTATRCIHYTLVCNPL